MMRDVSFEDVLYTVAEKKTFGNKTVKRQLLKGVSGVFRHGQLSVIMGPSGAGKSSLLNAISGYRTEGVSGTIHINKKTSCYITQEDCHQPLLTIDEMMHVACRLKLKDLSDHEAMIEEILADLHLSHRKNVTADRLSGGERKRLSIALELVANPSIFFLDEPTSGLDEVTAAHTIRLLRELTKEDRTVICTIHQPSAAIFELFDNIYLLAKGQCVYQGSPKMLLPFLSHHNLPCPKYHNPADYIIELCDTDSHTLIPLFSETFNNGKYTCMPVIATEPNNCEFVLKPLVQTMAMEKIQPKEGTIVQKMKQFTRFLRSDHAMSICKQFLVLFQLMMLKTYRNRTVLLIQLVHHLVCGVCIGLIFLNAANDGTRMFDHLKFCMGVIFVVVYTQVMVPILSYPQELKIVKKECFNRWYELTPYYLALTVSRLPLQILFNSIFLVLVYFLAGLPIEFSRFATFLSIGVIVSFVSEGMGLAIGATFNVTNGCAVGPMMIAPFLGLAVYGFDFAADIPMLMYGVMKMSFIRGGVVSLVLTVFGFNRKKLDCTEVYCHFDDPKVLLRYLRIENMSLLREIGFLIAIMLFFRILFYLSLRKRFYK